MSDRVSDVVAACLGAVLRDEPWQDLGFPGRPRHGGLFQRWRATWRVALEKRALQQMLAAFTATYIAGGAASPTDLPEVVAAYTGAPELARSLGYGSQDDARRLLTESIARYLAAAPDKWATVLVSQLDPRSVPDEALGARLLLGCAQFGANLRRMIDAIKQSRT